MATLKLVGFADHGFSSHRECVVRFVPRDCTWARIQEIANDICFEMQLRIDPYIAVQPPHESVDRLQVFDTADEEWRYAVQSGQTKLGFDDWKAVAYSTPKVIFEIVEDDQPSLIDPTYYNPEYE